MKKKRHLVDVEVICAPGIEVGVIPEPITCVDVDNEIIPGRSGTTFIPSVSSDGVISWTNDGGLPNPDPVSIIGPPGEPTTVNGKSGPSITLTAEDVGALASTDFDLIDCGTSTEVI